jgi:hypothetical protein
MDFALNDVDADGRLAAQLAAHRVIEFLQPLPDHRVPFRVNADEAAQRADPLEDRQRISAGGRVGGVGGRTEGEGHGPTSGAE